MQRTGRARVNPRHPQAFAVCQRCGFWINHVDGRWQHEWRGARLANIRVFVCQPCLDKPFIFNKPIIYPPDPVPIQYAFPENFETANNGSPFPPPLPWPVQAVGPAVASPPTPAYPVYETPPLPPLPEDIEGEP
jgi:hypothetical protein